MPVCAVDVPGRAQHDLFGHPWIEAARSISRWVSGGLRPPRRAAEQPVELRARSSSAPGSS